MTSDPWVNNFLFFLAGLAISDLLSFTHFYGSLILFSVITVFWVLSEIVDLINRRINKKLHFISGVKENPFKKNK